MRGHASSKIWIWLNLWHLYYFVTSEVITGILSPHPNTHILVSPKSRRTQAFGCSVRVTRASSNCFCPTHCELITITQICHQRCLSTLVKIHHNHVLCSIQIPSLVAVILTTVSVSLADADAVTDPVTRCTIHEQQYYR